MSSFSLNFPTRESGPNLTIVNAEVRLRSTNPVLDGHRCDWENMVAYVYKDDDTNYSAGLMRQPDSEDGICDDTIAICVPSMSMALELIRDRLVNDPQSRKQLADRFPHYKLFE